MEEDLRLPPVAKSIRYFCKKCDQERYHKVIAHKSTIAAKIECEVCGSKKTYKITEPKKGRKPATKKKRKTKEVVNHEAAYKEYSEKLGTENIQPYNMRSQFTAETPINHPKFGIGYIVSVAPDKIEVCFEDTARLLVHNRG